MSHKAIYKGKVHSNFDNSVVLFYEYRGYEYSITDEHNGYSEPLSEKHKYEQDRIDYMIDRDAQIIKNYCENDINDVLSLLYEE